MKIVDSSKMKDITPSGFPCECRPDISVFPPCEEIREYDASRVEFLVECKMSSSDDPFLSDLKPQSESTRENPFMSTGTDACNTAGQITAYTTQMLGAQYRTHTFTILVFKDFSRLIRWDRAGAIVTAPICHKSDPYLSDFLIRYNEASPKTRGHDITVTPATQEEVQCAQSVSELAGAKTLLSISIPDSSQSPESSRFIVCAPRAREQIPAGRWTRTSIAYDVRRKRRVLLKDSWRVSLPEITPEGDVYSLLHKKNVPNIPICALGCDVGDDDFHRTLTDRLVGLYFPYEVPHFTPYRHYRLVLDTIGEKLENFRNSKQMVRAVCAALVGKLIKRHCHWFVRRTLTHIAAHRAAWEIGILHRDLSPGNIMIVENVEKEGAEGLLIDWDLCKITRSPPTDNVACRSARTVSPMFEVPYFPSPDVDFYQGTWPFMAADLVRDPATVHTFEHDLESAFWVLIWMTVRYMETSWDMRVCTSFVNGTMSPDVYLGSGGMNKINFLRDTQSLYDLHTPKSPGMQMVLVGLHEVVGKRLFVDRSVLPQRMTNESANESKIASASGSRTVTVTTESATNIIKPEILHDVLIDTINAALKDYKWSTNDLAELQPLVVSSGTESTARSGSKRSRSVAEKGGICFSPQPAPKRSS